MLGMVLQPQCIKKGKYVGCPVSGTNAERIAGIDGMPACPLWVRYENKKALQAVEDTIDGKFPGREEPAWTPPSTQHTYADPTSEPKLLDIRDWQPISLVEKEMLNRNSELFSNMWGFEVMEGIPGNE